jgi:hypothetical protein
MSRKRFNSDQIIGLSREADVKVSQDKNVGQLYQDVILSPPQSMPAS